VQSFINSRRLKTETLKRSLATRSRAPVGWAEHPRGSPDIEKSALALQKISSDRVAAPPSPSDTASENTKPLPQTSPSPSPPADTEHESPGALSTQSPLASVERALIHVDPFANLPIQLDPRGQALYSFGIPFLTEDDYATTLTNPALSRSIGIYPHYNSEVRLCSTLFQVSAYLDSLRKSGVSHETIKWKFNLIQCVNRVISNEATRYGDDALNGIVLLLLIEAMTPGSQHCHLHSRALIKLLSRRRKRSCLSDHIDVAVAILTSKAQITYLDRLQPGLAGIEEASAWKEEVDFAVTTLRGLSDWVRQTLRSSYCNPTLENSVFLQSIQDFGPPADDFVLSQQVFALCYIAVALWEIQDVPKCIAFLQALSARHEQLGQDRSLPTLLWICIRGTDDCKDLQFQALRLTRVFHRLTAKTQAMVRSFLSGLCGVVYGASIGVLLTEEDCTIIYQDAVAGLPCS
jgi:hypothetical protein